MKILSVCKMASLVTMCFLPGIVFAGQELELKKGFGPNGDPYGYFRFLVVEHNRYPERLIFSKEEDRVYSLGRRSMGAYEVIDHGLKPIGGWPLTRWPDELDEVEEGTLYWDGYLHDQDWGQLTLQTRTSDQSLGCLMHSPLRYGQFVDPNQSVLVTFLGREGEQLDMVVFSPEQEAVIFSARLAHQDSYSTESFPGNPQWQHQGYAFETRGIYPGFRLYAKVFVGDFTGDGIDDLIQWRKQFSGRRTEDPVKGYELRHEVLHLYTLRNGEFERQSMDSEEVKEALSERSLTWQKGYPSKSECAEEKGELIPEMHDPLLNDPDVLK